MARRSNLRRMLTGVVVGFVCRLLYQQVANTVSSSLNVQVKETCFCHIDNLCTVCEPKKLHTTDPSLTKSFKPKGMYEVTRWQLFDDHHIFDIINEEPKIALKGVLLEDTKAAVEVGMDYLNRNRMMGDHWSFVRLENGYMHVDSQEGTDFILDLRVRPDKLKNVNNLVIYERLFRVVLRHSVTETGNIKLESIQHQTVKNFRVIVPASLASVNLQAFLENFATIQDTNVELLLILFHENQAASDDLMAALKQKASKLSARVRIILVEDQFSYHQGLMKGISEVDTDDLILILEDDMQITTELINHCRSICVEQKRVYFPVPFAQFNEDVIEQGMPPGKQKNMNKKDHNKFTGHWAHTLHNSFCAYQSDLSGTLYAASKYQDVVVDGRWFYNYYLKEEYEPVMAVEPHLFKVNHQEKCFPKKQSVQKYEQCMKTKASHLGSKPALGILYIEESLKKS